MSSSAPSGDVFVADGHSDIGQQPRREILEGRHVHQGLGQDRLGARRVPRDRMRSPWTRSGRVFVGDRGNNRIQIFDQDGKSLDAVDAVRQAERHRLRQQGSDLRRRFGVGRRAESGLGRGDPHRRRRRPGGSTRSSCIRGAIRGRPRATARSSSPWIATATSTAASRGRSGCRSYVRVR